MLNLSQLESSLWEAADQLRANSKRTATEYSKPVLGLIFLRHATNRYERIKAEIEANLPSRGGKKRTITSDDFKGKAAIYLPPEAHYDYLLGLPETAEADINEAVNQAMRLIEGQVEMLQGVLPKEYTDFDADLLRALLRIFARDELKTATGDVFGRIYEYFLSKFAMTGAQEGGEFFTPPSLVRMIVNVIEPLRGVVLDPASGSAGMFVQTGHFLENRGENPTERTTFYGQEKSETNTELAKMNLAVHGLDGHIQLGNTFYDFRRELVGACDYVMSNPPFNVDFVNPDKIAKDPRLFTEKRIPGTSSRTGTVSNANYLWIQYFYSYLKNTGRAGFVMASSASDAGYGEKEIRQQIIATGHVDVMIAIGTNFFYTRSLPCTLWFFDRGKPEELKDKVLMIDARNVYRVVSRKIRDFTDEHLQNITAIVWLYRGQQHRYLRLVRNYLISLHVQMADIGNALALLDSPLADLTQALKAFCDQLEPSDEIPAESIEALKTALGEHAEAITQFEAARAEALGVLKAHGKWFKTVQPANLIQAQDIDEPMDAAIGGGLATNEGQMACAEQFAVVVPQLKSLQKHLNEVRKFTLRAVDVAAKKLSARKSDAWNSREIRQWQDGVEFAQEASVEEIKATLYYFQQVRWLQEKFPEAVLVDVPGLCRVVTRDDIAEQDSSLTPGRYVGVAPLGFEDDEEAFEERMKEIHLNLAELNESAVELAAQIAQNFEELGWPLSSFRSWGRSSDI